MSATVFSSTRCRRTRGVEDEQSWSQALDGVMQALAVAFQVEAQDRDVDDGDVEVREGRGGGAGDAFEA